MKKLKKTFIFIFLISCIIINIPLKASACKSEPVPTAKIYTEGIYHFDKSIGQKVKITLKLITPDKPITLIIIEDEHDKLKYYFNFNHNTNLTDVFLDSPISKHTVILKGDGQLSLTFEE
ncbi:hypothetical protein FDC58_00860 [Clostridium botulinum]|uniref:hypothetical protein n=1 Tax=unclassified Clostridium TaxID=2614128 RepID=UPI0005039272|nr:MULTISPECIES: hypothetical protein [unclassified Clostridium]AIY81426.1 hypothetical protein U728_2020 [Clostridium botulinum 202F]KAI3347649.1 hypothetical protein CIT17_05190 [Clostridium botulinum]KFX59553.1 hypothetical protein KU40_00800 [Clostridium botulinum]KON14408.1 hypothetical protein ACP50_02500 [Clostridium botulinum]MBY6779356.1 hypothetical protein [Clostridium botulinum]